VRFFNTKTAHRILAGFTIGGLSLVAFAAAGQEAEDGVLRTCLAQGNSTELCICASLVLGARLGNEPYARFGAISDRIAEIENGADAGEGEMAALTGEGYQFFVPHGQAIAVCRDKIAADE